MTLRFEIFPSDLDATADFYTRVLRFDLGARVSWAHQVLEVAAVQGL